MVFPARFSEPPLFSPSVKKASNYAGHLNSRGEFGHWKKKPCRIKKRNNCFGTHILFLNTRRISLYLQKKWSSFSFQGNVQRHKIKWLKKSSFKMETGIICRLFCSLWKISPSVPWWSLIFLFIAAWLWRWRERCDLRVITLITSENSKNKFENTASTKLLLREVNKSKKIKYTFFEIQVYLFFW